MEDDMNNSSYSAVGRQIRAVRYERGLSLRDLSLRASVSKSTLSEIENGVHENPTQKTLQKIAAALDISIFDLMYADTNNTLSEPSIVYRQYNDARDLLSIDPELYAMVNALIEAEPDRRVEARRALYKILHNQTAYAKSTPRKKKRTEGTPEDEEE